VLAPTDAGLGQIIVNSSRVPMRIRQALNVEAGLNDGLAVPFLMFFIALAAAKTEGRADPIFLRNCEKCTRFAMALWSHSAAVRTNSRI
jgi:sodium/hydrogen antiporter